MLSYVGLYGVILEGVGCFFYERVNWLGIHSGPNPIKGPVVFDRATVSI